MSKHSKLSKEQLEDLYLVKHLTYEQIGKAFGITRAAVCKAMKRFGIDTSAGERFNATCDNCGRSYNITRKRYVKQMAHYCSDSCYYAHMAIVMPNRVNNRQGKRIARAVMEAHLGRKLKGQECVHHLDGDQRNNNIENLMLFATHSEHLRFHHQLRILHAQERERV